MQHERVRRKIQAFKPVRGKGIDWTKQPLGQVSDQEIANKLGVAVNSVWVARHKLGIKSYKSYVRKGFNTSTRALPTMTTPAPTDVDAAIPAAIEATFETAPSAYHLPIDWDKQPLGKMTDASLAGQLKCGIGSVIRNRRARGIPSFKDARKRGIDWDNEPLGEDFDRVLADKHGVTIATVRVARTVRGIPCYSLSAAREREKYRKSIATPAPVAAQAPVSTAPYDTHAAWLKSLMTQVKLNVEANMVAGSPITCSSVVLGALRDALIRARKEPDKSITPKYLADAEAFVSVLVVIMDAQNKWLSAAKEIEAW